METERTNPMDTENIDWNEVWKDKITRRRSLTGKNCSEYWADRKRARRYWEETKTGRIQRIQKTIAELDINPLSRVLDIGAGPGVLAVPLSEKVAHVTAVEPSQAMCQVLEEIAEVRGTANILCIPKRWEDIRPDKDLAPPYDIVVASMSLGMLDLRAAIRKMENASSNSVHILWHAGSPSWEKMPKALWPAMHGKHYQPGPKSDILFAVLYQMGIYPNVSVGRFDYFETFDSFQEALDIFSSKLNATRHEHLRILEAYLKKHLERKDGKLINRNQSTYMKMWWEKGSAPAS